jgi:aminopeptidase N
MLLPMIRHTIPAVLAGAFLLAACNSSEPATFESIASETTSAAPATTTAAATTTTTSVPPTPIDDRLGVGDSRYPNLGNGGYDVDHYTIDLTFDPEPSSISAVVEVAATATETLEVFSLDFIGFDIAAATVNGADASFERRGDELIVEVPEAIPNGEAFTTSISYSGTAAPVLSQGLPFQVGWRTDPSGNSYVIGEPDGGRAWLPLNDHPSDKATYTFMLTVPEPYVAAANGTLVEQITDLGWATWVWESTDPMASYLATVVIGELEIVEDPISTAASGVDVRNVLPPDLAATPPPALSTQGEMIAFFEDIFGPYPFEAYGIAVVDDFEGALENQTLSIFGRGFAESPRFFETVLVHELAHQWFGDSVTPADWGDIWLNEGFATYAEWLWLEHTVGEAALLATVEGTRSQIALSPELEPPGNPPADDLFSASVYQWGGLTLHALRTEIGDEAFFETLRSYADAFRDSNATTSDFIAVAESVSGAELDDLFDLWLYSETVPDLP